MSLSPIAQPPNVIDAGQVMATLNDWRTLLFVCIFLFVIMVLERAFAGWGMRQERRDMRAERERMWAVADRFTEAAKVTSTSTDKIVVQLEILQALASRIESNAKGQ